MFAKLFAGLAAQVVPLATFALETTGTAVQAEAVRAVSQQSHPYGTKTPASPGGPPAMISGTLARSIGVSAPLVGAGVISMRVGMIPGNYPWYSGKTPASLYARYLETTGAGRSGVRYPFLLDAYERVGAISARAAFRVAFSGLGGL